MSIRAIIYVMACVAAFYGFPAAAATVVSYSGDVFVNQGNGFHKINGATLVKVGDSVMVSLNGLAQVRLEDGNIITVAPGKVLSVPLKARAKDATLPDGAGATADLPLASPATTATTAIPVTSPDLWGPLAAAALLAGGLAGAAALANETGPASP